MYIPKFNQVDDRALLLEAMQAYPFALLVGSDGTAPPTGTHLPLVVKDEGPHGVLLGHFAHANSHWQQLAHREALVVFSGPHAYISPSLYADADAVPTWNYIAIHAYGTLEPMKDEAGKMALLEEMIQAFEPDYLPRWHAMPDGLRRTMLAGITGFRLPIDRIEGKFKLSQNRPESDRHTIQLEHGQGSADQQELARWMARLMG